MLTLLMLTSESFLDNCLFGAWTSLVVPDAAS
jgi:hypothetical protein